MNVHDGPAGRVTIFSSNRIEGLMPCGTFLFKRTGPIASADEG
jgi:hypothetical protein